MVKVLLAEGGLCGEALDGGPCVGKGRGPVWGAVGIAGHSGRYKHRHTHQEAGVVISQECLGL